jgi:hypothetical protein
MHREFAMPVPSLATVESISGTAAAVERFVPAVRMMNTVKAKIFIVFLYQSGQQQLNPKNRREKRTLGGRRKAEMDGWDLV